MMQAQVPGICRACNAILEALDGFEHSNPSHPLRTRECPNCGSLLSIGGNPDW